MSTVEKYSVKRWQAHDINRLLSIPTGSANWSEMGCFKTSTGLWVIDEGSKLLLNGNGIRVQPGKRGARVLIVTTKSGKTTFFESISKCLDNSWAVANVTTKGAEWFRGGNDAGMNRIVLAHYNVFTNARKPRGYDEKKDGKWHPDPSDMAKKLISVDWDIILVDEAHRIKNRNAQWTKNLKKCKARYKHVMTGTGFVNTPDEVWSLLNFLYPKECRKGGRIDTYWNFREKYCLEITVAGFRKIIGFKPGMKAEYDALVNGCGVRRRKREVYKDLHDPVYSTLEVDLNPTQRRMYEQIKSELKAMDSAGLPIHAPNVIASITRMRQIAVATPVIVGEKWDPVTERRSLQIDLEEPSSKIDALLEKMEELNWNDEQKDSCVVFTNFAKAAKLAKDRLIHAGYTVVQLLPTDTDRERQQKVAMFQEGKVQVFLTTIQLGGESITLTRAQTAFFLDRSWSPGQNAQAESRIWRPGQTGVPHIIHIHARNTIDNRVKAKNDRSTGWFRSVFG